nr:ATP synthase F0 subunit 6 [Ligia exotica]
MMTNLFSVFDPASSVMGLPLNWLSVGLGVMFISYQVWVTPSRGLYVFNSSVKALSKEMGLLLGQKESHLIIIFISLFVLIVMNNFLGLVPYIFTATSHLLVTLSLALPLWLGYFLYGWVNHTTHMLAHLVPQGTPGVLMPFMVLIETISSVIRPGTLAVRLAANMIAGHLLLVLMSGAISIYSPLAAGLITLSQIALISLESAVAVIQSYVFAILSTLYASEV